MTNPASFDIAEYLATVTTYALGSEVFVGTMPDKPDLCCVFFDKGGRSSNPKFLLEFPRVEVLVRGQVDDYVSGYEFAYEIKDALLGIGGIDINNTRYSGVNMSGDIQFLGYDVEGRSGFSLSFEITREPSTSSVRLSL